MIADQDGETLQNQYLDGPGYAWLTVWQDGFSGDVLNIDNVQDGPLNAVPEPTSILLLLTMVGLTGFAKYRRTANNR